MQLHVRMLLLSCVPFLLALLVWGVVLSLYLQPLLDCVHSFFSANDGFRISGGLLTTFGLGALKTVIVPLIVMAALMPLMILTALLIIRFVAMPAIAKRATERHFPHLAICCNGNVGSRSRRIIFSFFWFAFLSITIAPFCLIPLLAFVLQPALWAWLIYRVVAYDVLGHHASEHERNEMLRLHRWPLLTMGVLVGILGTLPTLLWMQGSIAVTSPFLAVVAIWFYVLLLMFAAIWFQYYCLDTLAKYRAEAAVAIQNTA